MTDAPKHRMVDPPEKMEKEAVMSGAAKSIAGDFPASYGTKLPQGIRNMERWGKTTLSSGVLLCRADGQPASRAHQLLCLDAQPEVSSGSDAFDQRFHQIPECQEPGRADRCRVLRGFEGSTVCRMTKG